MRRARIVIGSLIEGSGWGYPQIDDNPSNLGIEEPRDGQLSTWLFGLHMYVGVS